MKTSSARNHHCAPKFNLHGSPNKQFVLREGGCYVLNFIANVILSTNSWRHVESPQPEFTASRNTKRKRNKFINGERKRERTETY